MMEKIRRKKSISEEGNEATPTLPSALYVCVGWDHPCQHTHGGGMFVCKPSLTAAISLLITGSVRLKAITRALLP